MSSLNQDWHAIKQFENLARKENTNHWMRHGRISLEGKQKLDFVEFYKFSLFLKFDPNQPRNPAGSVGGGQWTNTMASLRFLREALKGANKSPFKQIPRIKGNEAVFVKKIEDQLGKRGWDKNSVRDTINNPSAVREATNRATGNQATVYYDKNGHYVSVDRITKQVVQISDRTAKYWIPDSTIVNPWRP